ncbi:spidroin-1-like isoform X2 [Anopheles aquasalis]|uniref:spidroin-1-like isoform X2 n=1 Tax=Anopheles aquasalis TaxID=42839 RepID=UPI00215A9A41|nr:spidroin-1-like isoform X2 [Anopheles aquasalis]
MLLRVGVVVLGLCLTLGASADDVIECTTDDDKKGECVKLHLCRNGVINDDGANIIDIRFNPDNVCEDYLLKCCAIPEDEDDQVLVPPSSLPQQPDTGNQPGPNPGSNPGPGVTGLNAGGVTNGPGSPGQSIPPPAPDALDLAQGKPKPSGGGPGVGSCNCKGSGKCCGTNLEDEQLTLIGGDLFPGPGKPTSDNLIKENHPQQPVHGGGPPTDIQRPNPSCGLQGCGTGGPIGGQNAGDQVQKPVGAGGQPAGAGSTGGPNAGGQVQKPVGTGGEPAGAGPTGGPNAGGQGQGPTGTGSKPSGTGQGQEPTGAGGQPAGAGSTGGPNAGGQVQKPVGTGGEPAGAGPTGGPNAGGQGQGPIGTESKPSGTGQGQGPTGAGGQPASAGSTGGPNAGGQVQKPVGTGGEPTGTGPTGGPNAGGQGQGPIGTESKPSGTGQGQEPTGAGGQPAGAGSTGGPNAGGQGQGPTGTGSKPTGTGQGQGTTGAGGQPAGVGSTGGPNADGQGQGAGAGAGKQPGYGGSGQHGAGAAKPSPPGSPSKGSGSGGSKDRTGEGTTQSPFTATAQPLKCGLRNVDGVGFRITGDKDGESEYGEFPWMVAILKQEKALDQIIHVYQCGGSLIHPSVVLTAAHCVQDKSPQDITLRLGEWDTQTKNEIFDYQDRKAVEIVTHPEFYKGGLFNDVALVFLDKPAELMDTVNTICLPPADFNFDASRCFASGWGKDVFGKQGTYQVILKKIELPVMPRAECQTALRTTRLGRRFKLHSSFICAGGEKGRDTCKGDGGSPLVCPIPGSVNHYYQAGMVAWGIGCGEDGIPGVYVNVPLFRGWIEQHLTQRNISHSSFQYA